jgi:hypothetical protein
MRAKLAALADRFLVPNWRQWHRLWSVRIAAFWTVMELVWEVLPSLQDYMPPHLFLRLTIFFAIAILFARLTHQPGLDDNA